MKGDSFLYTFDSTDQAGTFWYHSHLCMSFLTSLLHVLENIIIIPLATQYCDGLCEPFIVYDPENSHADLYDVDDGALTCLFAFTAG